jgi:CRP-like cAMP-binding protein
MERAEIEASLRRLPHFHALPDDLLAEVAAACRERTLRAGETLFLEGEPCRAFFAVLAGGVKLVRSAPDGSELALHHVQQGHCFAEAALLQMPRYPASAVALETPTRLLEIGGERFLRLFRGDSRLAASMVGSLCGWLTQLVQRIEDLNVVSAGARLARYLLRLPASGAGGPPTVRLPIAKKELAAHLSIQPETLSRLLRRWQDGGLVESRRKALVLLDLDALLAIADREEKPPEQAQGKSASTASRSSGSTTTSARARRRSPSE